MSTAVLGRWVAGLLLGGLFLGLAPAWADELKTWPAQIELTLAPEVSQRTGLPWDFTAATVNVRIKTKQLTGTTWRLWVAPRGEHSQFPVEVIGWAGQPPFVNGAAARDLRVLAGQGPIDGHEVNGNLTFSALGNAPEVGIFIVPLQFILETLP